MLSVALPSYALHPVLPEHPRRPNENAPSSATGAPYLSAFTDTYSAGIAVQMKCLQKLNRVYLHKEQF